MKSVVDGFIYYLTSFGEVGKVDSLYRYPVKGFDGENLCSVELQRAGSFPIDRQFALLKHKDSIVFDPDNPVWLHKENFLCTFTEPDLMSQYRILVDGENNLKLFGRSSDKQILPTINMSTETGRQSFAEFFSEVTDTALTCITAKEHQFGNTSSSWKKNKDTRTVHIINKATVDELSDAFGVELSSTRFRPNIVVEGPSAWSEWDWIDGEICLGSVTMKVIAKTVRCDGISVDPLDPENVLDIPNLMIQHFPEHGPYFGVYAVVEDGGRIETGDPLSIA